MAYNQKYFQKTEFSIKDKRIKYYLSPILVKNKFKHGFFTKISPGTNLSLFSKYLNANSNCVLNQIHSNKIILGSKTQGNVRVIGDGLVNDKYKQNLWIYTADCMPILFADKNKRYVAAIHCGRKGLEIKIIKNLIKIFCNNGCSKEDLLVAIGPSISRQNYLIDNMTLRVFYEQNDFKDKINFSEDERVLLKSKKENLLPFNLKEYAHIQLLNENVPNTNIDISSLCTYESNHEFYSWRRSKTSLRQWNFISAD